MNDSGISPPTADFAAPQPTAPPRFSIWPPLLIFLVFTLVVGVTGYVIYRRIADSARYSAGSALAAAADLKVRQVGDWLNERRTNAERASRSPFMGPETEAWLGRGAPPDDLTAQRLTSRLSGLRETHRWDRVFLVDREGHVKLDLGGGRKQSAASRELSLQAMEARQVIFWDIHPDPAAGPDASNFGYFAPLLVSGPDGERAVAALAMEMDPASYLFPLIRDWPLPSATGESLLVRREGNTVLYINEVRHRRGSSLKLRLPMDAENFIAAQALRGQRGPMTGVDYRGVPVLACARKVPGAPWFLIAKVDMEEVNGPISNSARVVALFGLVLVLAAGLTTASWLRQQRANALLHHYRAERERTVLTKHLDYLTRYANDIILLMDGAGRIIDANERAVSAYGRPREALIGLPVRELRTEESAASYDADWAGAEGQDGIVFETVHRRSDGTVFPVEVSARVIRVDGETLRQSIVRDISERKEAERKILRLSNLYNAVSQMNQAIVRGRHRQGLFEELCRVAVEYGRLEFAWVGLMDEATTILRLVAKHGREGGFLEGQELTIDRSRPAGHGPVAEAILSGHSYVCNDFAADPTALPVRDAAARAGFKGAAAFPLTSDRRVVGALSVCATEVGFFDPQTIALLEEMTDDVSFALDGITREELRRAAEEALRESEEKYRLLFSNERDAIHVFDPETGRILDVNAAFASMSGYSRAEAVGMRVTEFSDDPDATRASVARVRDEGSERVAARRFRRKDGSVIWVEITLSAFVWRGRQLASAILRDITDRKKAQERSLLWTKVLENSPEAIIVTDARASIVDLNKAFTAVTGYSAAEAVGANPRILASGRHDAAFYHVMWRTLRESGRWQGEIWNRRKNGELYPCWLSINAVHDEHGELTHYVGVSTDITERKASADRINFLANHDSLTGLPNRTLMNDLIERALSSARRRASVLGLLFLDLDRFKTINDSLGHPAGDTLLQAVAGRLRENVREADTVGRLGGDEFLILLPELSKGQDAAAVAEKIVAAMQQPIVVDGRSLRITASVGISVFPGDGDEVTTLIRNADAALYHAKERGRNNYQFFTADMNVRAFETLAMEISLRGALERGEFALWYQPQVETATGRIIGAEALLRWRHPDLGLVLPAQFIPVAEEHGLIVPIGEWALRTACAQVRRWHDEGIALRVSVNVSAVQFRQPGLGGAVRAIVDEARIDPHNLELELTESVIMREAEHTVAVLEELSRMGISLSIDDFGTGYSSLSYLRRFPINRLKIDQSFVRDITTNADAAAIAAAIIGMGRSLKLHVIAEGVETAEQMAVLAGLQCDELQGFHIALPMEAAELSRLLRTGAPLIGESSIGG